MLLLAQKEQGYITNEAVEYVANYLESSSSEVDSILSFYSSPTGRYHGFECLQQRDDKRYSVRGAMMEEDKIISTWALELTAA